MAVDTANFSGLSQAGAPVMIRGSSSRPRPNGTVSAARNRPVPTSGGSVRQRRVKVDMEPLLRRGGAWYVASVNITLAANVDDVNTWR